MKKRSIYISRGAYEKAVLESELLLLKKPDLAEGWLVAGALQDTLGNKETAIEYYQRSIQLLKQEIVEIKRTNQDSTESRIRLINLAYANILAGNQKKGDSILNGFLTPSISYFNTTSNRSKVLKILLDTDPTLQKGIIIYPWDLKES